MTHLPPTSTRGQILQGETPGGERLRDEIGVTRRQAAVDFGWQIQCDLAQVINRQAKIDTRAFEGAMAQEVSDRFEREAGLQQVQRIRMSKAMDALERNSKPTSL